MAIARSWIFHFIYTNITVILAIWLGVFPSGNTNFPDDGNATYFYQPEDLGGIPEGSEKKLVITLPFCELNYTSFRATVEDEFLAVISNQSHFRPNEDYNNTCHNIELTVKGIRLGVTKLTIKTVYNNLHSGDPCSKNVEKEDEYDIAVVRPPSIEIVIFTYGTAVFLIILNFGFGCSLKLSIVKEILKKPIAPGVGFCCQYVLMPLIGFAVAMTLLRDDPLFAFGLICSSCSPGGAGSNVWCLLLGGDVSLSLTMTFFSLSASLGMMPLWLFLLGRFFIDTSSIVIPYLDIMMNLTLFVGPCFVGIILRKLKKPVAERLGKMIKPVALLFLAFLLTYGLYTNRYIYAEIGNHPYIIPPAFLQPYFGFMMGFLMARHVAKQPKYRCITIAIETGVQNVTIPMVLLQNSFKQPYGDLAAVMPVTTAHFTPLPMIFAFFGLTIYKELYLKRCKKQQTNEGEGDEDEEKQDLNTVQNGSVIEINGTNGYLKDKKKKNEKEAESLLKGMSSAEIKKNVLALEKESVI